MAQSPSPSEFAGMAPAEAADLLSVSPETVCFLIVKARQFDVKEGISDPDSGSNPSDDKAIDVLEDLPDDPTVDEMTGTIDALDQDQRIDLVTLAWLGRDDYSASDWSVLRMQAAGEEDRATARYLLGMPLLADYLEEGLAKLNLSCTDIVVGRL